MRFCRKACFLCLAIFIAAGTLLAEAGSEGAIEKKRVIVVFKDRPDRLAIEKIKGVVRREFQYVPAIAADLPINELPVFRKRSDVLLIETDQKFNFLQSADWGIGRVKAPLAWSAGLTGKGVKVAVLDTGIAKHEDLRVAGGAAFTSYTASYLDDNGHGTHVAGIIAAQNNMIGSVGIAPGVSLYSVKVLGQDGSGYLSDIIAGVEWSINNKMDIINLSLGSPMGSAALKQAVDSAYQKGVLIVAAAGNEGDKQGEGDTVEYPARYDSVIAVAATDTEDRRANFSATGSWVEVAAPGKNIFSTYLNSQYKTLSGTSMAAPYVTGNLALLKQALPKDTPDVLRDKLHKLTIDLAPVDQDTWYGWGLIQAPENTKELQKTELLPMRIFTNIYAMEEVYHPGEAVALQAKAYDSRSNAVVGAKVKVIITDPLKRQSTLTGTTGAGGEAFFTSRTRRNSVNGLYRVVCEMEAPGYAKVTDSTEFILQ